MNPKENHDSIPAGLSIPSLAPIFMKLDFTAIPIAEFVVIIFAFLFVDIFDTLGTLIGVASFGFITALYAVAVARSQAAAST